MRFGSLAIPAIFADGRTIVELKTATGAFDPFAKSSRHDRYLRIPAEDLSRRQRRRRQGRGRLYRGGQRFESPPLHQEVRAN
jgi:hypothetical protein